MKINTFTQEIISCDVIMKKILKIQTIDIQINHMNQYVLSMLLLI